MTEDQANVFDTSLLPPQMRLLQKIIGMGETIELVKSRGGRPTRMPTTGVRETALDKILKRESILALCKSDLAGHRLDLPKADKILVQIRNMNILAARGHSTKSELASEYGLTTRMIQIIWNGEPDPEAVKTMDMFN